jgi:uncharacterized protein (TIGR03437 family)
MGLTRFLAGFALLAVSLSAQITGPNVRIKTTLGNIDITLLPNDAPRTVENFLRYVNRGSFNNSAFHRLVQAFVLQGGGYTLNGNQLAAIAADPAVVNEFKLTNIRGTLAMAKTPGDPNSATNQWFFNLANNASNLDFQNGGFTVFARVANTASLNVMDRLAGVAIYNLGSPFDSIPLVSYSGSGTPAATNYLTITGFEQLGDLTPPPAVFGGGVISASGFGGRPSGAAGSLIEIYGQNFATVTRQWAGEDFRNGVAPTTLEGVSVTIGGQSAFVNFVSPGQVNVQVPAGVPLTGNAPVVVTVRDRSTTAVGFSMRPLAPAILAPTSLRVGSRQFVAGFRPGSGTPVTANNSPAVPGETLIFYGTGFGPVTPDSVPVAGSIPTVATQLLNEVQVSIGGIPARVEYAGLAPGLVGVYQFNVVIPGNVPSGDQTFEMFQVGERVPQTLFLTIR